MILIDFSFLIYPRKQPTLLRWPIRRVWVQLICWTYHEHTKNHEPHTKQNKNKTYHEHTKVWMQRSRQLIALQNAIDRPFVPSTLILLFRRLPATVWSFFTGGRYLVLRTCQGSIWQDVDIIFERPGREVEPGDFSNKGEINQGQTHHNDVKACFIVLLPD